MDKRGRKVSLIGLLGGFVLISTVLIFLPKQEKSIEIRLESPESSFYQEGNVQSRLDYERQKLVDPETGEIPENIRAEELKFARHLDFQEQEMKARMAVAGDESAQQAQENVWTSIGPKNIGGRTRALAIDVTDEDIILAGGVSGGIWRSENGGQSWSRRSPPDQIQSVTALTQDIRPGKENIWYYGTGELVGNSSRAPSAPFRGDGIFKSTDGGLSWQPIASTQKKNPGNFVTAFQYVWDITTDPNSPKDVIIAAVYGGIVRSENGGQTWQTVLGEHLLNVPPITSLNEIPAVFYTDLHRAGNGVFYASLSSVTNFAGRNSDKGGVYRSDDGVNWTRILDFSNAPVQRTVIESSVSDPNIVYFLADRTIVGYGLWKYDSETGDITSLSTNLPDGTNQEVEELDSQDSYNLLVRVHPENPDVVFIGGTNLYRSTDGFRTKDNITWIGGYASDDDGDVAFYPNHHPDQHELVFFPGNPNRMISANDGGLYLTENCLASEVQYTSLNNGFITTQFYTASISRYPEEDFVIGGTQDNGTLLTLNEGQSVLPNGAMVIGGDGGFTASTPFGIYYYMSFQNSKIYRLTLNSQAKLTSFARVDPVGGGSDPSQPYLFVNPYVLDPNNANRMYLAGGDFIWVNQNLSQIPSGSQNPTSVGWKKLLDTEISQGSISAIAVSTEPRNVVYYGTSNGKVYRIDNANSDTYEVTDITDPNFSIEGYVSSIAVDPTNANHILVAFSNYNIYSIWRSRDGGNNYQAFAGNLETQTTNVGSGPSVRWVSIVPKTNSTFEYFAGTSIGLYSTTDSDPLSSPFWTQESPFGIGHSIVNMVDYRQVDGKIVAATHGNGLYTSQISAVSKNHNLVETDQLEVTAVYPNPFSSEVLVRVNSPDTQFIVIRVYDSRGNEVKRVSSSVAFPGENEFIWQGTNDKEELVPNGIYMIRISHKGGDETRRVVLQRN